MQTAYICSPFRAKTAVQLDNNIEYAQWLTKKAIQAELASITPHLYITQVLCDNIEAERAAGLAAGIALLDKCDVLVLGERYGISSGMSAEIEKAKADGIKIVTEKELDDAIRLLRNKKGGGLCL